jgi:flagellar basal body P-ring formation protein FlgA
MTRRLLGLVLAALVAAAALPASAAERPRLRPSVTVSSDYVRLGDLIDNAGPAGDEPVFRAPDLGTTGTVQTARVVSAALARNIADVDTAGVPEVAVTRASRTISIEEMTRVLTLAIIRQNGLSPDADLQVTFDASMRPAQIEPGLTGPLQVTRLAWSAGSGRFDASFGVEGSTVLARTPVRAGGTALETVSVPVYARAVNRGETLRDADIVMDRQPRSQLQGTSVAALADAIGQAVRRSVRQGQVVATGDLTKPQIIARNEAVTLVYEVPNMVLSVRAKALEAGAEGDSVSVLNIQSNRVVQATITGPGRVSVVLRPRLALK